MNWKAVKISVAAVTFIIVLALVVKQVKEHNTDDNDPVLIQLKQTIATIEPNIKNTVFHRGEKSYAINKKHIYMCLKDEFGKYYDQNTLMYVGLHELAHTFCDSVGHTEEFHIIFQNLLDRAESAGIYDSSKPMMENYCQYEP